MAQDVPPPAVTVTPVTERDLTARVVVSGLIAPVERVAVQPLIEGQPIDELLADVGDTVQAGEVLARLSSDTLTLEKSRLAAQRASARAAVAQAEAGRIEAEAAATEADAAAERIAQLQAQGATSQAAIDQARANRATTAARLAAAAQQVEAARAEEDVAQAQIADIDLQLQRTAVTTPVAGEVMERNADRGAIASAGSGAPMFVLIRDGALELRADVTEADLASLRPGQPATLRVVGGVEIDGTVRLVEPQIDATTRLGRVRIAVNASAALRPGMFAEGQIVTAERPALALPIGAVGHDGDGDFALRVQDGTVHRVPVEVGIRDGSHIEITDGLTQGDRIVARAGAFVRDGDRVTAVDAE
nr:efflux RND transporter periplasmic adaptor subunit [Falsirhodobacter halotolerans]